MANRLQNLFSATPRMFAAILVGLCLLIGALLLWAIPPTNTERSRVLPLLTTVRHETKYPETEEEMKQVVSGVFASMYSDEDYRITHSVQRADGSWFVMLSLENVPNHAGYSMSIERSGEDDTVGEVAVWRTK